MPACRTQRPRRSRSKWSTAARTSACGCRPDAGWPGKRGAHRALAARFRRSHHAPRSWPFARGGSARVKSTTWQAIVVVVPMRHHSCHSAAARSAAGAPADGAGWRAERVRACRAAYGAIRPLPRCAAPRAHPCWHTHACPMPAWLPLTAGAHRCAGGWCARAAGDGGALPRAVARCAAACRYRARTRRSGCGCVETYSVHLSRTRVDRASLDPGSEFVCQ